MKKQELAKRYLLFVISLFFSALGVAFTKAGGLGVSPISSTANVLSMRFSAISIGNWLIVTNCVLILGQILLLRKNFQIVQLLQLPLSFLFGYFTDLGVKMVSIIPVHSYVMQLIMVIIGVMVLGFGISLAVIANVVMNSGEAFVKALSDISHKEFGNVKVIFDISCVILAVILSMLLFDGVIQGTREGTLITALGTGFAVKFFSKFLTVPVNKCLSK